MSNEVQKNSFAGITFGITYLHHKCVYQHHYQTPDVRMGIIDLEAKEWRYFVNKTETDQIVPLSDQAVWRPPT